MRHLLRHRVRNIDILVLSFILVYIFAFLIPTFYLTDTMMFYQDIPAIKPIGRDFKEYVKWGEHIFDTTFFLENSRGDKYSQATSPVTKLFFHLFAGLPEHQAYQVYISIIGLCFCLTVGYLPGKLYKQPIQAETLLLLVTGLGSYGFHFEVERGQFNVIAMSLTMFAIYLFHHGTRRGKIASYLLFCLAVQLKLYPCIFVAALTHNFRDLKQNLVRWSSVVGCNILLTGVFGFENLRYFLASVKLHMFDLNIWIGNHSLQAFYTLTGQHQGIRIGLLFGYLLLLGTMLVMLYDTQGNGLDQHLLLLLIVGACIIPGTSHDFKLTLLTIGVACYASKEQSVNVFSMCLSGAIFICYFFTTYSYTNYAMYGQYLHKMISNICLQNKFCALYMIGMLSWIRFMWEMGHHEPTAEY